MNNPPTEASFLKDVATHEMTVIKDDGLYRHVRFRRPGTNCMYFDVITWPGYLAYTGDMGSYTFTRIKDMFAFFRRDPSYQFGDKLYVNPDYWGQKVESIDRNGPIEEYSPDSFRQAVCEWVDETEASQSVRKAVVEQVLSRADDGEHEAVGAAMEFECDGFMFRDFWEVSVREYSHRFLWCCYALAWAVREYDRAKAASLAGAMLEGATKG